LSNPKSNLKIIYLSLKDGGFGKCATSLSLRIKKEHFIQVVHAAIMDEVVWKHVVSNKIKLLIRSFKTPPLIQPTPNKQVLYCRRFMEVPNRENWNRVVLVQQRRHSSSPRKLCN